MKWYWAKETACRKVTFHHRISKMQPNHLGPLFYGYKIYHYSIKRSISKKGKERTEKQYERKHLQEISIHQENKSAFTKHATMVVLE